MFFFYELITILLLFLSPIIYFFRLIIGKEDFSRILERYSLFKISNSSKITLWFHGASVGEILSVIPIIKIFDKDKKIKKILLTSSTKSSAQIIKNFRFKKTLHKYYPLDENYITKRFIKFWKPKTAIFIDSEIWPNMFKNLEEKKIPIILINGRITKKSYRRWSNFSYFAREIFSKISLALPQNQESFNYLKKLGVKNIKSVGNLKYFGETTNKASTNLKKLFINRKVFCCASTHSGEENFIAEAHIKARKKVKNLITIIIPRHIHRVNSIIQDLKTKNLKVIKRSSGKSPKKSTDIYIVDTYGEANQFYSLCNLSFVGGSLIKHGGQNPLEPARNKNYILHGPHTDNFDEVYSLLTKLNIAYKINSNSNMAKLIQTKIEHKQKAKVSNKLKILGENILKNNISEINKFL